MDNPAPPSLSSDIQAALDWWREAGVDFDYANAPTLWISPHDGHGAGPAPAGETLAPGERAVNRHRVPGAPNAPAREEAQVGSADWPTDLPAFRTWWLEEPSLDDGRLSGRVAPRGAVGAEMMVIVAEPEADDADRLLSGPEGRLLDSMLLAMGIDSKQVYVASVLPRRTPMADWDVVERRFAGLLRHHIGLVKPARLLLFGTSILPLTGHDPAHYPAVSRTFNHEGLTIPLLAGKSLAALLERPRWKAGLWQGWLDWTRHG